MTLHSEKSPPEVLDKLSQTAEPTLNELILSNKGCSSTTFDRQSYTGDVHQQRIIAGHPNTSGLTLSRLVQSSDATVKKLASQAQLRTNTNPLTPSAQPVAQESFTPAVFDARVFQDRFIAHLPSAEQMKQVKVEPQSM